jgi:hypothetical protein
MHRNGALIVGPANPMQKAISYSRVRLILLLLVSLGCPPSNNEPAATCTKIGETCKLGPGLLGVCAERATGTCPNPPCLVCMGQH